MQAKKTEAVAAIIERNGRFLIGRRSPLKRTAPGYYCPISGRIEAGESQADAVVREVREETGLRVVAGEKVAECDTHDGSALIHWWTVEPEDDAPARLENDEHSELLWVSLEEMKRLSPSFPEDIEIFAQVALRTRNSGNQ